MTTGRRAAIVAGIAVFILLLAVSLGPFWQSANDTIRLVLGTALTALIILRPKRDQLSVVRGQGSVVCASVGTLAVIIGIITGVGLIHWIGGLLLVYACLVWAMPDRYSRDVALGMCVAFWIHPPAGQFELGMQWLSVNGAEWLLHCFNMRIWADEYILHTALASFGVPQACSGMRTATTVFLTCLGTGILLRLRWYHLLALISLALAQVLTLNIIRISSMVALSPKMPEGWSDNFLHDSLAVFLIASLLLTQVEVMFFRTRYVSALRRRKTARDGGPSDDKGSIYLPLLQRLMDWKWAVAVLLLVVLGGAGAVYKRRPYHRAMMISGIVRDLAVNDLSLADRAAAAALDLYPDHTEVRTVRVRVLLARDHTDAALAELDQVPEAEWTPTHTVFKALVLMQMNRADDAIALVDKMPVETRTLPGVAMVRAEFAAFRRDADGVADNIVVAMNWDLMIPRARSLFPVLAEKGKWDTIVECYSRAPHRAIGHALLDLHAHMKMGKLLRAGSILKQAMERWPDDTRLLTYLATLASGLPGSEWEKIFEQTLKTRLPDLSKDQLAAYIENSFRMKRPDLAWLAYRRLGELDSTHPLLYLAPVRFGDSWFTFRKHWSGIASPNEFDTIDFGASTSAVALIIREIAPLGRELSSADKEAVRAKYLERCLDEIERRRRSGKYTAEMWMTYLVAEQLARSTEKVADCQQAYEVLRKTAGLARGPRVTVGLIQVNALMQMGLGTHALLVADRTEKAFPRSAGLARARAGIWSVFGFPEEALFALDSAGLDDESMLVLDLLYRTERFVEAERLARKLKLEGSQRSRAASRQAVLMQRAELAVDPEWLPSISAAEMARESERCAGQSEGASPYISGMNGLKAEWYRNEGMKGTGGPGLWRDVGRDRTEKGIALTEFALVLARQRKLDEARDAADMAVAAIPDSRMLWRLRIALTGGDPGIVSLAYQRCPGDPEIWLAMLVNRTRQDGGRGPAFEKWAAREIKRVVRRRCFSTGTMTRAGDFLLRRKATAAASIAARYAMENARGLLPAYVLGLRCAVAEGNFRWAVSCAEKASKVAIDPYPFLRFVGDASELARGDHDSEEVLKKLLGEEPREGKWARKLARLYLHRDVPRSAFGVLRPTFTYDRSGIDLRTIVLSADAARLAGDVEKAIEILDTVHVMYPRDRVVLNNLVYCLSLQPKTLARAQKLLPRLMELSGDSLAALDTAAAVSYRAGDIPSARKHLGRMLELVEKTNPRWLRDNPRAAEFGTGDGVGRDLKGLRDELARKIDLRSQQ